MERNILIDAAMGRMPCDLELKNANVIDVLGHGIKKCSIYIKGDTIVCCGSFDLKADKTVDLEGMYVSPAFVDAHVHIESSMLTPSQYARTVIPHGTGTVIADPHEIANVCGADGLRFMAEDSSPLRVHYMLPSCVPATPFDSSGAVLDADLCTELWESGAFLGMGEMMNYPGVVGCDADVLKKLDLAEITDGHIPMVSGRELQAYICGGIANDHECSTAEEALEKVSLGLNIYIREGTGAKNLEELIKAVTPYNMSHFAFCTDDKHIDDVVAEGSISHCISKAISLGMEPVDAFTLGTYNAARFYSLKGIGAIAPRYKADLVVMTEPDPRRENITAVYIGGSLYNGENKGTAADISKVAGTVHIKSVSAEELTPVFDPNIPVIETVKGSLITKPRYVSSPEGLAMCANIERHRASGRAGTAFVKGLDIHGGAVAQTIGHDSHNITVIGDNPSDMALAVNSLGADGGIAVAKNGALAASLTLEAGGIMSARPYEQVLEEYLEVSRAAAELSSDDPGQLMMLLSFLSLLVIPELKLSDRGLFDVNAFDFISKQRV